MKKNYIKIWTLMYFLFFSLSINTFPQNIKQHFLQWIKKHPAITTAGIASLALYLKNRYEEYKEIKHKEDIRKDLKKKKEKDEKIKTFEKEILKKSLSRELKFSDFSITIKIDNLESKDLYAISINGDNNILFEVSKESGNLKIENEIVYITHIPPIFSSQKETTINTESILEALENLIYSKSLIKYYIQEKNIKINYKKIKKNNFINSKKASCELVEIDKDNTIFDESQKNLVMDAIKNTSTDKLEALIEEKRKKQEELIKKNEAKETIRSLNTKLRLLKNQKSLNQTQQETTEKLEKQLKKELEKFKEEFKEEFIK